MDNQGLVWDQLLASARQRESTTELRARSTCPLPLRTAPEIHPRNLPDKPRLLIMIPGDIRAAIRHCVAGAARWPLVLSGSSGTGKTCAALCLLDYAGGHYWAAADLCEELRRADAGRLETRRTGYGQTIWPEDMWEWIKKAPLVVLDELGCRDRVSDFQYETAKRVLDKREGRPLMVLSNLTLAVLAELYDDRFVSRLASGTVLELAGEDRRLTIDKPTAAPKRRAKA